MSTLLQQLATLIGTLTLNDIAASNLTPIDIEYLLGLKKKLEIPQNSIVEDVLTLLVADKRIQAIKRMREAYVINLADAKSITDQFPNQIDRARWLTDTLKNLQPNTTKA